MKFKNPYWSERTKLNIIEYWILVTSYAYYELSENIVPDRVYDMNAKQLLSMMEAHPMAFKNSTYYEVFVDFEGGTGFDLISKLNEHQFETIKRGAEIAIRYKQRKEA